MSDAYSIALAYMGLSVTEFLQLTPRELSDAVETKNKINESSLKFIAELMRMQTWWSVNKWLPRAKKVKKEEIIQFEWDSAPAYQTVEQMRAKMKAIASMSKSNKKNRKQ